MSDEAYARLTSLLLSQDENGDYLYDREEIFDMMSYAILQGKLELDQLSENLHRMLTHVFVKAGVGESDTPDTAFVRLEAYFEANPPRSDLLSLFLGTIQELAATPEDNERVRDRIAAFLGSQPQRNYETTAPPEGSTRAGPMARFSLSGTSKKSVKVR